MAKQEKVRKLYDFIAENLYLCLPDMEVAGQEFNSTLLFEILTCLNKGKQMLFGEYGLGKTTSSEQVASMIDAVPIKVVLASEVRGHAEQTEEKMVARPDMGKLNQGIEEVIWDRMVLSQSKIIDELNRLPPSKQNIILDGIDRGNWRYLSELVQVGDFALFATCNYEDAGNGKLVEPVLDRFDIATESKRPSLIQMSMIKDIPREVREILDDRELADKILDVYDSKDMGFEEKRAKVMEISDVFRQKIAEKTGLEMLARDELEEIKAEIEGMEFSNDADLFYTFIISELASCQKYGMKRKNERCPECHYSGYACKLVGSGLSVRSALAIAKYAKSLAWMTGKDKVTVEDVEKVLPYAIWHKISLDPQFVAEQAKDDRNDPPELYAAKKLIEQIKHRFTELAPAVKKYVCLMRDGKAEEAREFIKEMDHPVFKEFLRQSYR